MEKGRLNEAKKVIIAMNTWGYSTEKKQYRWAEEVMNVLEDYHAVLFISNFIN